MYVHPAVKQDHKIIVTYKPDEAGNYNEIVCCCGYFKNVYIGTSIYIGKSSTDFFVAQHLKEVSYVVWQ